jgi:hypothetical protein
VEQCHLASRACIIQKTMVVLLHFLTGTEGRTISPRTGSLPEDPKVGANLPIQVDRVVHRAHKRTHEYSIHAGRVAEMLQQSKSKCHCRGGKSVPGNETERIVKAAQNKDPLWREIKLLCVVYATRQGTGISCAPPKPSLFPTLSLHRPRMPTYY